MTVDVYHNNIHYRLVLLPSKIPERYHIYKDDVYYACLVHYKTFHRFSVEHRRGRFELNSPTLTGALEEFLMREATCTL